MNENHYQNQIDDGDEVVLNEHEEQRSFLSTTAPKHLLIFNALLAVVYFLIITFAFPRGNTILFFLLIFGEVFHIWQVLTYLYTVWDVTYSVPKKAHTAPGVDVFITITGEPVDILETTARAALNMRYPNFAVYFLNDGYVAKKDAWQEPERLAKKLGVTCITRKTPGGAKAGNVNHALSVTKNPFVVVFDVDHVPHEDFLEKTMSYFADPRMAFVQTPQYYKNHELNVVTKASWEQQELFFGPICRGKNRLNATTMCGTNMVIRRTALEEVGGMCEDSIAEDFITGLLMHGRGWKSYYHSEVLAEGLAPEDFLSYYKQQFRWARGGLDVIFTYNVLFRDGLTLAQRIQYLSSVSYWFSGVVIVIDASMPLVYFFTGAVPLVTSTLLLAMVFLPYIFMTLYTLQRTCNFNFTFRSLAFSMAGFIIHIKAVATALVRAKSSFSVTPKTGISGNFMGLVRPHIAYIAFSVVGIVAAFAREGPSASLIANGAWAILNSVVFFQFIRAANPNPSWQDLSTSTKTSVSPLHP